jgi:hypothetical protein
MLADGERKAGRSQAAVTARRTIGTGIEMPSARLM